MTNAILREKSLDDLNIELTKLRREKFKIGMSKAGGDLTTTHMCKNVRKKIARLLTIIKEKGSDV